MVSHTRYCQTCATRPGVVGLGYTATDIHNASIRAAASNRFLSHDHRDLIAAAWDAIVDMILAAEARPTMHDLATAGRAGIWDLVKGYRVTHGYRNRDVWEGPGSAPKFAQYWMFAGRDSFDDRVCERLALPQVMAALSDRDQTVLWAAATHGDYQSAAKALGMPGGSFRTFILAARRAALAAWHDGETPHRYSNYAVRHHKLQDDAACKPCGTSAAFARHRRRGEPVDAACEEAERARSQARRDKARHAASTSVREGGSQ